MTTTTVSLGSRGLPGQIDLATEIFAIGDVHGQAAVLHGVLRGIGGQPKAPGTERILIFLGDLIDRGPDSIGTVSTALAAGPTIGADRVVMLPGNHELELVDVLDGGDPALWLQNGGRTVMDEVDIDWRSRPWDEELADLRTAFPADWIAGIRSAPSHLTIGDLIFVHAGIDPHANRATFLARDKPRDDLHWATIRNEFLTWTGGWDRDGDGAPMHGATVIVHGHTPAIRTSLHETQAELSQMDGIDGYSTICVDAGAASRPQIGWARFWVEDGRGMVEISATFAGDIS
ncbi:metallophosphoesterase [Loktanella atrilutea]|uniref:metallophosphoesterase n=1 Tax=Loktanella atrilutea TaxID=366533 RepID=UPI0015B6F7DA|nr:metallophosphoesterase [Loktanella atrilutea]